jgi:ribulose-5-phosphate 4-epimerase/fuculose-1-phosphate aldolase
MILRERRMSMVTDAGNQALLRKALCEAYRDFERFGLSSGSAGNVSVRWTGGLLISPAGATAASAAPEAFVVMSLDGDVLSTGKPSSEWAMHAEIIGARRTPRRWFTRIPTPALRFPANAVSSRPSTT